MVKLMTDLLNKLLEKCWRQSENFLIFTRRSKEILSSKLGHSIFQKENWIIDVDKRLKRESMKMLEITPTEDMIKSVDRGVSEYWGDILRYHKPVAVQMIFLVIIILTLGPWIGPRYDDDVSISSNKNDYSSTWISTMRFTKLPKSPSINSYEYCTYGYFCSNKKTQDGEPVRRKRGFLRRKRDLKDLID